MEQEPKPSISITCDTHGFIWFAYDINAALQYASDHKYEHPLCEDFVDDFGVTQKHVHIIDGGGNEWS